MITNNTVILF